MSSSADRQDFLARRALDVIITVALPLPFFGALFAQPLRGADAGPEVSWRGRATCNPHWCRCDRTSERLLVSAGDLHWRRRRPLASYWRSDGDQLAGQRCCSRSLWGAEGAGAVMVPSEALGLAMYWRLYRSKMPSPLGRPVSTFGCRRFPRARCGLVGGPRNLRCRPRIRTLHRSDSPRPCGRRSDSAVPDCLGHKSVLS